MRIIVTTRTEHFLCNINWLFTRCSRNGRVGNGNTRCRDMETPSALLALREEIPSVTDGIPSQRTGNAAICWGFFCQPERAAEQPVELWVVRHHGALVTCRMKL